MKSFSLFVLQLVSEREDEVAPELLDASCSPRQALRPPMAPPASSQSSPPSYSTKPASGEVRLDHSECKKFERCSSTLILNLTSTAPRYPLPFRSLSTPSLSTSNSPASPWPSYTNYPPSTSPLHFHHSSSPQAHPYESPSAFQSAHDTASPSRSATESSTSHSSQERLGHVRSTHRRWRSRRGERVGLEDVFFEGDEGGSDEGLDLGRRSTTFVLPSYQPGEEQEPLPRGRRRKKVKRALKRVKKALCVDCGEFGDGGWEERGLVGAAAGASAVAVGVAAWALCG